MKLKVIACRVFTPELDVLLQQRSHEVSISYLPLRAHNQPDNLRADLQKEIDESPDCDAVILAYGLCGNATAGLQAGSVPLLIPRAHDCSQILLGGHAAHTEYFSDHPSRGWTSRGYLEEDGDPFRSADSGYDWDMQTLTEQYGEENALFVWESLRAADSQDDEVLYFLDVPETRIPGLLEDAAERAALRNKELKTIPATLDLLSRLLGGRGGDEILVVSPGQVISPSWDSKVIVSQYAGHTENTR